MAKKKGGNIKNDDATKIIMSGELCNLYLLCGPETYLRNYFTNVLKARIGEANLIKMEGALSPEELQENTESGGLFSERTIIIVKNSGIFGKADDSGGGEKKKRTEIESGKFEFLRDLDEDHFVIFNEDGADEKSRMFKFVSENGVVCQCPVQSEAAVINMLSKRAAYNGRNIAAQAVLELYRKFSTDLESLMNEVDRLCLLVGEGETIDINAVRSATELSEESKIFDFTDAVAEKNPEKALKKLAGLKADRIPEAVIMTMLARHFTTLYDVKKLTDKRFTNKEIGEKTKLMDFIVTKYVNQSRGFAAEQLAEIIDFIAAADNGIKSGNMDPEIGIELIIQKCR